MVVFQQSNIQKSTDPIPQDTLYMNTGSNSKIFQVTGSQEPVFFAINTDIFDDRNESPMVLSGIADARTENLQQIATENTSFRNGSMDISRRGETLTARSRSRYSSLACIHKVASAYINGYDLLTGVQV